MFSNFFFFTLLAFSSALSIPRTTSGVQQVATFDDLIALPALSQVNPVGVYKGLKYNSLNVLQAGTAVKAQSGANVAANSITGTILTGGPSISASTVKSFDLQNLYFGCAANTLQSAASVPQQCTIAFTAFKAGSSVAYDTINAQFNPDNAVSSKMTQVKFPSSWTKLGNVEISVVQATTTELLNALLIDNVSYKSYSS